MTRRAHTDDEKAEALRIYEEHGPTAAQKQTGIHKATVTKWAKAAGVATVAVQNMREAREAIQESNAERRARLVQRLYGIAETSADLLENPAEYQTILKGEMGIERGGRPGFIPAQDKQRELTAMGIALDKAAMLEKFDNDNGAREAKGLLVSLAEQIGVGSE